jgi:hypothetical protein
MFRSLWTEATAHLFYVRVEYAFLFQVVRHGVLGQERRLQPDLSANPLAFAVRSIGRMVTSAAATELRAEVRALNLIKLVDLAPGRVADGAGNVDLEFQEGHNAAHGALKGRGFEPRR